MRTRMTRRGAMRAGVVAGVLAGTLAVASPAGATTYSWSSNMTGAAQSATGLPSDPDGSGTANITADTATNRMCGTFSWTGVASPVVFGHIHQAIPGQPENPGFTINLFGPVLNGAPSGVTGCTTVPGPVITAMATAPYLYMVTIHNQEYPAGPIRGQLAFCTKVYVNKYNACPPPFPPRLPRL
jgi:hypothetical protein